MCIDHGFIACVFLISLILNFLFLPDSTPRMVLITPLGIVNILLLNVNNDFCRCFNFSLFLRHFFTDSRSALHLSCSDRVDELASVFSIFSNTRAPSLSSSSFVSCNTLSGFACSRLLFFVCAVAIIFSSLREKKIRDSCCPGRAAFCVLTPGALCANPGCSPHG